MLKKASRELLNSIPDYKDFPTLEELDESSKKLAEQYPDIASIKEVGRSRENRPLLCLKIGSGSKNALVFGLPHPNEPIGFMLMEHLSWELARNKELRDELDYTWYFLKAWDADGYKLNEGWIKGPFTITNYMRHFYRPAGFEQVDWTFPISYKEKHFDKPLPETVVMMKLIDDIKPRFIYSLHNAGIGGTYWYMSEPTPEIFEELHAVPKKEKIPIHLGEPESPLVPVYYPAIYGALGVKGAYDALEKMGRNMKEFASEHKAGDNSASYAKEKYNTFTLLTELPYFYDPRIDDQSEADMIRRDAVIQKTEENHKLSLELIEIMKVSEEHFSPDNHFYLACKNFSEIRPDYMERALMIMEGKEEYNRKATVAEKFDNLLGSKFYQAITFAMIVRANESELELMKKAGEDNPAKKAALEKGLEKAMAGYKKITDFLEAEMNYKVIPIKSLVAIQLECGLIVADYLHKHPDL